jgi:hypothetical protein
MKNIYTEKEVLQKALEVLQNTTKLNLEIRHKILHDPGGPDATIQIIWQDMDFHFVAEVKRTFTRAMLGGTIQQLRKHPEKTIFITTYTTPQVADLLKEMDVPFIDTVGNVYINEPPLFIYVKGNKFVEKYREKPINRAFQPAGLQLVFALLCNPGLENAPFREIAKTADVALGTVGWVIRDLQQLGNLVDMGKRGRRLTRKKDLLNRWATTYPDQLRPKKILDRYKAANPDWWKNAELETFKAYWGGEIAAGILTKYLKPQIVTIYTREPLGELFLKNRIVKDPNGDIEILEAFWKFEYDWQHHNLVHPILIYADLLATGDERNIETAEIIYEKELTGFIGEN